MTVEELMYKLNTDYGLKDWPPTYEVDYETYANACQYIFFLKQSEVNQHVIQVSIGKNCGIMFKGVELLLKKS